MCFDAHSVDVNAVLSNALILLIAAWSASNDRKMRRRKKKSGACEEGSGVEEEQGGKAEVEAILAALEWCAVHTDSETQWHWQRRRS